MYSIVTVKGFQVGVGHMAPKLGQNYMTYDFYALFDNFHFQKIEMNLFSGSTIFWRLLGEYEPLSVLYCYCKGLSSCSWDHMAPSLLKASHSNNKVHLMAHTFSDVSSKKYYQKMDSFLSFLK